MAIDIGVENRTPENDLWVSDLFGSDRFRLQLRNLKDEYLLEIHDLHTEKRVEVSFNETIDVGELYTIAATDGFSGWEKVLEKINVYFFLDA